MVILVFKRDLILSPLCDASNCQGLLSSFAPPTDIWVCPWHYSRCILCTHMFVFTQGLMQLRLASIPLCNGGMAVNF